jgi:hypothetical protein
MRLLRHCTCACSVIESFLYRRIPHTDLEPRFVIPDVEVVIPDVEVVIPDVEVVIPD